MKSASDRETAEDGADEGAEQVAFEVIPAIDVIGGRVVRLAQGDFARETVYGHDPLEIARRWAGAGARRLHIVDLDGARAGRPIQTEVVRRIVAAAGIPCQVAGGIRDEAAVAAALASGADRVVLGTALLRDPELGSHLVQLHGPYRVVAAIDVRDGIAVGSGWVGSGPERPMEEVVPQLARAGITLFAVTAIVRDGLQAGPDMRLLDRVAAIVGASRVIASAGVTTTADVRELARRGYAGAILGRALYEGTLSFSEALRAAALPTA